jgi:CheY-like chemotaxis protein
MEFALSANDALDRLDDPPKDMDLILILSDINMPGMTGLELLPRIRALHPTLPMIMITAYGDAEMKRRALEGGAQGLVTKPIDFVALKTEIDTRVAAREHNA